MNQPVGPKPRLLSALELLGGIAVPGTLVGIVANAVGLPTQEVALISLGVMAVIAIVLFAGSVFAPRTYLTLAVGVALGVSVMFWLHPPKNSTPPGPDDLWGQWGARVLQRVDNCKSDDPCVARAIGEPLPVRGARAVEQLEADLRAGLVVSRHERVAHMTCPPKTDPAIM
jgi:hypothetical protein